MTEKEIVRAAAGRFMEITLYFLTPCLLWFLQIHLDRTLIYSDNYVSVTVREVVLSAAWSNADWL